MKATIIKYGLISGVLNALFMLSSMAYVYNKQNAEGSVVLGFSLMAFSFSVIYFAVKKHRNLNNNGFISFVNAFKIGLGISIIGACIYVIAWAIEFNFFMPDFLELYNKQAIKKLQLQNLSSEEIKLKIEELNKYSEMYKNPGYFFLFTFIEIFPVGLIISLISAIILKKTKLNNE